MLIVSRHTYLFLRPPGAAQGHHQEDLISKVEPPPPTKAASRMLRTMASSQHAALTPSPPAPFVLPGTQTPAHSACGEERDLAELWWTVMGSFHHTDHQQARNLLGNKGKYLLELLAAISWVFKPAF